MSVPRDYLVEPGLILHAYNRAVNKGLLFRDAEFYGMFLQKLREAQEKAPVSIIAHTLMPTHFHMILQQYEPSAISTFMQHACSAFSHWTHRRLKTTGPLYDSPYGGTPVPSVEAFLRILFYVLVNPVKAGLVSAPEDWIYSSCKSLLTGLEGKLEDYSLIFKLVGGPERLAYFLENYKGTEPMPMEEYLCPEYFKIWEDRTSGEFLRYEQKRRKAGRLRINRKGPKRMPS